MKRYIIASKADKLGQPNYQNLSNHFELGWEVTCVHMEIKHHFATGALNRETDIIVTLRGREFLYSKIALTMAWEDFAEQRGITNAETFERGPDVIDIAHRYASTSAFPQGVFQHGPDRCYRFPEDAPLICNLDTPSIDDMAQEPFAVSCWRYRHNHSSGRNTPADTAKGITAWLAARYAKVFIVGHDTEHFCNAKNIIHITLPQFAGLIQHKNCGVVLGAMTGTLQLANVICRCLVIAYQHNPFVPGDNGINHPVVFGDCVNLFRGKRAHYYEPQIPVGPFLDAVGRELAG